VLHDAGMPRAVSFLTSVLPPLALLAACGGGGPKSTPIAGPDVPIHLLTCRARVDEPHRFSEFALRDERNLGLRRVADRTGRELGAGLHPDGVRVVYARERDSGVAASRELFVGTVDGSAAELRLTHDQTRDDEPCWARDGARVLCTSERSGSPALWLVAADGAAVPFVVPPVGVADSEADWCHTTNRVVWSRRDATGRHTLWAAHGDGTGAAPITDGGTTAGSGNGDRSPAYTRTGDRIVFVRRLATGRSDLCSYDVATATVTTLLLPAGEVQLPRPSPTGDRVFFGIAEPSLGRGTLRLAELANGAATPTLLWPDERWQLTGLDVAPTLPAAVARTAPQRLDITRAEVQIAAASAVFGSRAQLANEDADEFLVLSTPNAGRQIAGINCRLDLPLADATSLAEFDVRVRARLSRASADTFLRLSLYNPVDARFDTVVEFAPTSTSLQTAAFSASSLRHVTRERQLRVTVIGDFAPGDIAELRIDLVEVTIRARSGGS
jgi:hypothetical protein